MIASKIARQIILENTGKEPNDGQIVRAEMLIVAFANEYHKALTPKSSTKCVKSSVVESLFCDCSQAKGVDIDEEGFVYCIECQKNVAAK